MNSYKFGKSLNNEDYNDLMDLLNYDFSIYSAEMKSLQAIIEVEFAVNKIDDVEGNELEENLIIQKIKIA